jgi:ribosomal protein S18 acetylase RimI-like enzyme
MIDESPTAPLVIRIATPEDIPNIDYLDSFSTSPTRRIHREIEKYFGSIDPSTHEHTVIFLAEVDGTVAGKAELMLPPGEAAFVVGYIKRVVVHPLFRKQGIAKQLMLRIIDFARNEYELDAIDLHVWEDNHSAIHLYENLGFELKHRELYYRLPL